METRAFSVEYVGFIRRGRGRGGRKKNEKIKSQRHIIKFYNILIYILILYFKFLNNCENCQCGVLMK
jgi:hypothetical protein